VFLVRYELNFSISFRGNSVFKGLHYEAFIGQSYGLIVLLSAGFRTVRAESQKWQNNSLSGVCADVQVKACNNISLPETKPFTFRRIRLADFNS
jgi:hypothetical protein